MNHLKPVIQFHRAWSMPSRHTFSMKPVRKLLDRYCVPGLIIVDPFAGQSTIGTITNDIAEDSLAQCHEDAAAFLRRLNRQGIKGDILLIDPPYSPRQMKECYSRPGVGRLSCSTSLLMGEVRRMASSLVTPHGYAISFGWNSTGMGKPFETVEILLVNHGSSHNDTICVVDRLC